MGDSKKLSGVSGSEVKSANGFDSFQSQLDAFLEQEKSAIAETEQDASESQRRLDRFINNLQRKLDSCIEEDSSDSGAGNRDDTGESKPKAVYPAEQVEAAQPANQAARNRVRLQKKQPAKEPLATTLPVINSSARPGSYSTLIFRVLIGASCAIAIIFWLMWPIEQVLPPQIAQQPQGDDASLSLPPRSESALSRPVVMTVDVAASPQSVLTTQEKTTAHDDVLAVKKAAQADARQFVRLKVGVRVGNIRDKPGLSGKVLFRLAEGAVVIKLAEQKDWFQIRLRNGTIAWAHRSIFQSEQGISE